MIETGLEADRVTYKPRVYKIPMIRMFFKLTNLRMNGSIKKIYRNVYDGAIRCQCGLVETVPTNDHIMLQA